MTFYLYRDEFVIQLNRARGYVPFDDVSEAALRTTLTQTTDKNLHTTVVDSLYFTEVQPLDPRMTIRDAWLQFVKKPREYIPSSKDDTLGYMADEDIRFWPRSP